MYVDDTGLQLHKLEAVYYGCTQDIQNFGSNFANGILCGSNLGSICRYLRAKLSRG